MTYLLDVNLLFVFHQPRHIDYEIARRWFHNKGRAGFATSPITQAGLLRLLVQNAAKLEAFAMKEAKEALRHLVAQPAHIFWPDSSAYLDATERFAGRLHGYRQITDAYLLGLAIQNQGRLATLDHGTRHLAGNEFASHLEVIE